MVELWLQYCCTYTADVSLEKPVLHREKKGGIQQYETYYKQLDLYYQFSTRLGKNIDADRLVREREKTEETIMRYLAKNKKDYIGKCRYCGAPLPVGSTFMVCDRCYRETRRRRG